MNTRDLLQLERDLALMRSFLGSSEDSTNMKRNSKGRSTLLTDTVTRLLREVRSKVKRASLVPIRDDIWVLPLDGDPANLSADNLIYMSDGEFRLFLDAPESLVEWLWWTRDDVLNALWDFHERRGRTPKLRDIREDDLLPSAPLIQARLRAQGGTASEASISLALLLRQAGKQFVHLRIPAAA